MTLSDQIRGRLIVSCQAEEGSPFRDTEAMELMARTVVQGGACALRLESIAHVERIAGVGVPVIGLVKRLHPDSKVYITPTMPDVIGLVEAGARVVALDATPRDRPRGERLKDLVGAAHRFGAYVMGDVDSVDSARFAEDSGVDWIGTTLAGYTAPRLNDDPDIAIVRSIARATSLPVIAEGRYRSPDQLKAAFDSGAWSVVVGTSISDPLGLTRRFASSTPRAGEDFHR